MLSKKIAVILILLFIGSSFGCSKLSKKESARAYVYKTQPHNFSRGQYYKLHAFCSFEYKGEEIKADVKLGQRDIQNYFFIKEGDSIVVEFPAGKPEKIKIVKLMQRQRQDK